MLSIVIIFGQFFPDFFNFFYQKKILKNNLCLILLLILFFFLFFICKLITLLNRQLAHFKTKIQVKQGQNFHKNVSQDDQKVGTFLKIVQTLHNIKVDS